MPPLCVKITQWVLVSGAINEVPYNSHQEPPACLRRICLESHPSPRHTCSLPVDTKHTPSHGIRITDLLLGPFSLDVLLTHSLTSLSALLRCCIFRVLYRNVLPEYSLGHSSPLQPSIPGLFFFAPTSLPCGLSTSDVLPIMEWAPLGRTFAGPVAPGPERC